MRFAVLGDSPSVTGFVHAVARNPDHELAAFALAPRLHAALREVVPGARLCRGWEELLSDARIDAVVVAAAEDQALQAARQLAAAGKALFVGPVVAQAGDFAYELTLLQAEQEACLVPLFGLRANPLVGKLREWLAAGAIGPILHARIERQILPSESAATGSLSSAEVVAALAPDIDLIRAVWGEYSQVTTFRVASSAGGISMEAVTLAGALVPQVTWSATAVAEIPTFRLTVVGELGEAVLAGAPDAGTANLVVTAGESAIEQVASTFDSGDWLLAHFQRVPVEPVRAESRRPAISAAGMDYPIWDDFTRAVELLDASERSIRRRRTIEIHFEAPSERGQFKTQMTAAGCSLLMLTLVAIIAYLTATSLLDMSVRVKQVLVALIFLPLGIFLALQALLVLARPSATAADERRISPAHRRDPPTGAPPK